VPREVGAPPRSSALEAKQAPTARRGAIPAAGRLVVLADGLVLAAVLMYALTIRPVPSTRLGVFGLAAELPVPVYVATGLLVVGIAAALTARTLVVPRLACYLVVLTFFLYGTAAIVYPEGRYSWLYKTVGVVQYVNLHGALNASIDIYQNWPGFFALSAWFVKVLGVASPLAFAKWAQLGFELMTIPVLAFALRALPLTDRERWSALFLYVASNWIAQDYFSPQALGVVLSIGVVGIALHALVERDSLNRLGLFLRRRAEKLRRPRPRHAGTAVAAGTDTETNGATGAPRVLAVLVLLLVFFVLVFVHELSPYLVLAELAAIAAIGRLRPAWVVLAMAAVAVGYLAPRFGFVNSRYGLLASIGNFFGNVRPPSSRYAGTLSSGVRTTELASVLLSAILWFLGALGAYLRWRRGRPTFILAVLAAMPAAVLFAVPYGGEAVLRVYLFSLPWTAALAASALSELRARPRWLRAGTAGVVLASSIVLFGGAFYGNDRLYVMPTSEVQALGSFYRHAVPGPVYELNNNFPGLFTARYNLFPEFTLAGTGGVLPDAALRPTSGAVIALTLRKIGAAYGHPAYVVLTPTQDRYGTAYGLDRPGEVEALRQSLLSDPQWRIVVHRDGILIVKLPPSFVR
jgi:hypothetical protein